MSCFHEAAGHLLQQATYFSRPPTSAGHLLQQATYFSRPPTSAGHLLQQATYFSRPPTSPQMLRHSTVFALFLLDTYEDVNLCVHLFPRVWALRVPLRTSRGTIGATYKHLFLILTKMCKLTVAVITYLDVVDMKIFT